MRHRRGAPGRAERLHFASVAATNADTVTVPPGYAWRTLIAWGDPLFDGMRPFDPDALTRDDQEKRFGTHNDMLALFPADYAFLRPSIGPADPCANNEYVSPELTFQRCAIRPSSHRRRSRRCMRRSA